MLRDLLHKCEDQGEGSAGPAYVYSPDFFGVYALVMDMPKYHMPIVHMP